MQKCILPFVRTLILSYCNFATSFVFTHHELPMQLRLAHGNDQVNDVLKHIHPISEHQSNSYKELINLIPKNVQVVLIGEGTHGTQEFFEIRSDITRCLIEKYGFDAVLCEGDVQPFIELNRYVTSDAAFTQTILDDRELLSDLFSPHFPDWMWSNVPMAHFVTWLKQINKRRETKVPVQLLGIDMQCPFDSMDFIIEQLYDIGENVLAAFAEEQYATLLGFRPDTRKYGDALFGHRLPSQEISVKRVLHTLMEKNVNIDFLVQDNESNVLATRWFEILENAHAVVASEMYHRCRIYPGYVETWNGRSVAFLQSIGRIMKHISKMKMSEKNDCFTNTPQVKVIVWAHNSHVGDMSATGYSSQGQTSLGQLCRGTFGEDSVFLIGMTTYCGSVRAAQADRTGGCWRGKGEVQSLTRALGDSHEYVLHSKGGSVFGLPLQISKQDEQSMFNCHRNERFVGSCYLQHTELRSHYTRCDLVQQFDYVFHVDNSTALTV